MPNHIKNRIEFVSNEKKMSEIFEKFNTHYDKKPRKAHDGSIICKEKKGNSYGWLNEDTKEFTRNDKESMIGMPEGWEYEMVEAWDRFPDFNKLKTMPESLMITTSSIGELGMFILSGKNKHSFFRVEEMFRKFWAMDKEHQKEALTLGEKYLDNLQKHGHCTWYEWSLENWGTKWNSYSCEKINNNVFEFETAWSSVPRIVDLISKHFPEVEIKYSWADEDIASNCGTAVYKNGLQHKNIPENSSNEAYELALDLWPSSKEYIKKDEQGNYVYVED